MRDASSAKRSCFSMRLFIGCSTTKKISRARNSQQSRITLLTMASASATQATDSRHHIGAN
eukprot:12014222-Alexandrium_andersonii.AAC.1